MSEPPDLTAIRSELDAIDGGLVDLIARRLQLVDAVGAAKAATAAPVRDHKRERQVLDRAAAAAQERGADPDLVRRIFRELVNHAVDRQVAELLPGSEEPVTVAFHGTDRTVDHLAALKYMASRDQPATFVGHPTYADAVDAVRTGRSTLAVVPVESTSAGSINEVYDLLQRSGVAVVGEETLRVELCLAATTYVRTADVTRILSDAAGLEHSGRLLRSLPNAMPVACADTTEAMRLVRSAGEPTWAAIGPPEAAEAYALATLQRGIGDPADSYLRFLVLALEPVTVDQRIPTKTSIVLVTSHEDGALLRCLQIIAVHGRSMTKLESRPLPGRPFEYLFFLDSRATSSTTTRRGCWLSFGPPHCRSRCSAATRPRSPVPTSVPGAMTATPTPSRRCCCGPPSRTAIDTKWSLIRRVAQPCRVNCGHAEERRTTRSG